MVGTDLVVQFQTIVYNKVMRRKSSIILVLFSLFLITGCATTENVSSSESPDEIIPIIPVFDDWQYKGFGKEYPQWMEYALYEDKDNLSKVFPQLLQPDFEINIMIFEGSDSDMCRHKADEVTYDESEAWLVTESWARINYEYEVRDRPYVYIKIFLMKKQENNL